MIIMKEIIKKMATKIHDLETYIEEIKYVINKKIRGKKRIYWNILKKIAQKSFKVVNTWFTCENCD